jgi:hypothetical protein
LSVGTLAVTNRSNAGDLFTASNTFNNIKPEPAERRVSASALAYGGGGGDDLGGVGVPPWIASSNQPISWWEMEKFSADLFYSIAQYLDRVKHRLEQRIKDGGTREDKLDAAKPESSGLKIFEAIEDRCIGIGLNVSAKCASDMVRMIKNGTTLGYAMDQLAMLEKTIKYEMEDKLFMYIPPERAAFYGSKEMFGTDVNTKFPVIQFDLVEAGNCYASGRGTAVVFHLMRIMEVGVQAFGDKLGVTLVNEKNWQNILDEINKAIKPLPPKDKTTVEMCQASANLYAVKLAWRNEVMHPNDTYTLEESDNLIRQVRLFMQQLAKIM